MLIPPVSQISTADQDGRERALRDQVSAVVGKEPDVPVRDAAKALLDAFGGNTPDWLRKEAIALEKALDREAPLMRGGVPETRRVSGGNHRGPVLATRFSDQTGIFFRYFEPTSVKSFWQHIDMNDGRGAQVGPHYQSKDELLSDHEAYLRRAGWLRDAGNSPEAIRMDWHEGVNEADVDFVGAYLTTRAAFEAGEDSSNADLFQIDLAEARETTLGLVEKLCDAVNATDPATEQDAMAAAIAFADGLVTDAHSVGLRAALTRAGSKLKLPEVVPLMSGIKVRADGDANFYHLLDGNDWVAAIHLNGKFTTPAQEAMMQKFADVLGDSAARKLPQLASKENPAAPAKSDGIAVYFGDEADDAVLHHLGSALDYDATGGIYGYNWVDGVPMLHDIRSDLSDENDNLSARWLDIIVEMGFDMVVVDAGNKHGDAWKFTYYPKKKFGTFVCETELPD
jgi:hypothetical protein